MTKLKKSNCDKTKKTQHFEKSSLENSICDNTQVVTTLKLWQKSKCDKTQIVTKIHKLKLWQNSKTQIVTKPELWQIVVYDNKKYFKWSFSRNILTPWQPIRSSLGSVLQFSLCFFFKGSLKDYLSGGLSSTL